MILSSALRAPDADTSRALGPAGRGPPHNQEIDNLRALITELRPAELDELGLEIGARVACRASQRHGRDPR